MGYKMWVMAESSGYVVQLEPYQGARHQSVRSSSTNLGLREQVVIDLLSELPSNVSYHVYMDNYFTSFRLLHYLAQNHVQATGVIRKNKLNNCPILNSSEIEKKSRGYCEEISDSTNGLYLVCLLYTSPSPRD